MKIDKTGITAQRDDYLIKLHDWREVAELAHTFLASLPKGWLAHTTGDIGALNEFYIKYRKAKFPTA